jgi:two-component system alkaline phosphatase synthesis response regulator PhoP
MKKTNILIIEDDPAILNVARDNLQEDGYQVEWAKTMAEGRDRMIQSPPDLLVLDLSLPDGDGLELCRKLGSVPGLRAVPVFIMTAKSATEDIVAGLEAGAEDYIVKPFNMREFMARVRAMSRRHQPVGAPKKELVSGKLRLSTHTHEVWNDTQVVNLTLREFDVLRVLIQREGEALSREEIIFMAWEPSTVLALRVVDVHVSHLRSKLGAEGKRIETVPQVGFKLVAAKK